MPPTYTIQVLDSSQQVIGRFPFIKLNSYFNFLQENDEKFKSSLRGKVLKIPTLGQGGHNLKVFFPAGVFQLKLEKDGHLWFIQDEQKLFFLPSENESIDLQLMRVGIFYYKLSNSFIDLFLDNLDSLSFQHTCLNSYSSSLLMDTSLYIQLNFATKIETIHCDVLAWKSKIQRLLHQGPILQYHAKLDNGGYENVQVFLTEMQAKTFNPSAIFDENWYEDDRLYFYALENANSNTLKRIAAETVMSFTISSGQEVLPSTPTAFARQRADPGNVQEKIKKLEKSFQHSLSTIGQDALDVLKVEILDRFSSWKDLETTLIAPIASLSQGSGIGKSKLAVQVIQDGPGFYIVTRQSTESTGYPRNNDFSLTLKLWLRIPTTFSTVF